MRGLGAKIGKVLEVGEARMDYKRVKVDFPLAKALVPVVKRKVQGFGLIGGGRGIITYPTSVSHVVGLVTRNGSAQRR